MSFSCSSCKKCPIIQLIGILSRQETDVSGCSSSSDCAAQHISEKKRQEQSMKVVLAPQTVVHVFRNIQHHVQICVTAAEGGCSRPGKSTESAAKSRFGLKSVSHHINNTCFHGQSKKDSNRF